MGWFGKKKDKDGHEPELSPREKAQQQLNNAVGAIYAVAILSGLVGVIALIFRIDVLLNMGLGISSLIAAVVYGGLAFWVQKKRSMIGLGLALGLYIADGVALIISNLEAGGRPNAGVAVRIALAYVMFQGFGAIQQLKSAKVEEESVGIAGPDPSNASVNDDSTDSNSLNADS